MFESWNRLTVLSSANGAWRGACVRMLGTQRSSALLTRVGGQSLAWEQSDVTSKLFCSPSRARAVHPKTHIQEPGGLLPSCELTSCVNYLARSKSVVLRSDLNSTLTQGLRGSCEWGCVSVFASVQEDCLDRTLTVPTPGNATQSINYYYYFPLR